MCPSKTMTTLPEAMDEFVDWDRSGDVNPVPENGQPGIGQDGGPTDDIQAAGSFGVDGLDGLVFDNSLPGDITADPNLDLVLSNVDGDDFSFWALQHFVGEDGAAVPVPSLGGVPFPLDADGLAPGHFEESPSEMQWDMPSKPCTKCSLYGYQCKTIREGQYQGFCTSCVALQAQCSLAPPLPGLVQRDTQPALSSFPPDTWLALNDQQNSVLHENVAAAPVSLLSASLADNPLDLTALGMAEKAPASDAAPSANKNSPPPPKIGARFSRESVKILKNWLSSHNRHPYPSDEEKEMLQRQTGLNKTQITNWLANARRRGKIQQPRSTSPHVGNSWTGPIDIPRRPGTPALDRNSRNLNLNPLERWVDSPPENEPATVTAIARAVASSSDMSSGLNSPYSFALTDDGSGRSLCNASSASSVGTSSGGSFGSAYSHASRGSFGSFGSMNNRGRRRRRRRATPKQEPEKTSLAAPLKTFQCTFCTETFRTKHDWQRHEKSLHLSLERWVCAPDGPRVRHPQTNQVCCVFCGEANPDNHHIEAHNHSACQERSLEERTFYRKDHLNQHLKLVHNVKFLEPCMKAWKVASPEIRSRCGFCGIVMDSWSIRVDHLAEHFKTGHTMADWKGDWGFEAPVLDMVENSIPPYLIDNERNSPYPYVASGAPVESPRSAYELIKLELAHFLSNHQDKAGSLPSDEQMQLEACRIIFASEVLSLQGISSNFSWLRDLMMSSDDLARQAQFGPLRSAIENRLSILKINGKDNLFEQCPLEQQLCEYVRNRRLLGLTAMDDELQREACRIVGRIEEVSTTPSDVIANWLVRLINTSTAWLANFRQRAHLPRTEDIACAHLRPTDPTKIDSTIHNYSRLETSLGDYINAQREKGIEPSNDDLQRQARMIIYEFDDGWNQTAADNVEWLDAFRKRHSQGSLAAATATAAITSTTSTELNELPIAAADVTAPGCEPACPVVFGDTFLEQSGPARASKGEDRRSRQFFLNDANCYRRLARELARFVASTMSPNNPNQHVPTDEELQHQARWILYDDDDPWNQTAADNAEWLQRFKRDVGILRTSGPGLPLGDQWSISQGGSGFAPPYAFPSKSIGSGLTPASSTPAAHSGGMSFGTGTGTGTSSSNTDDTSASSPGSGNRVEITVREGARPFEADQAVVAKYIETLTTRYERPATVFCSRELEAELLAMVKAHVEAGRGFPSDEALRAQARAILNLPTTAADDDMLLAKFKALVASQAGIGDASQGKEPQAFSPVAPDEMNLNMHMTDAEMDSILADISFDLGNNGVGDQGPDTNMDIGQPLGAM